jgi:hypothetical protein
MTAQSMQLAKALKKAINAFGLTLKEVVNPPSQKALHLREVFGVTAPEPAPPTPSALEREIEEIVRRAMAKTFASLQT